MKTAGTVNGARSLRSVEDADAISAAAHAGDAAAMRMVAMLLARGVACQRDWNSALAWQLAAAEAGDDEAQGEMVVLSADEDYKRHLTSLAHQDLPFPPDAWRRLAAGIDARALLFPPTPRVLSAIPFIGAAAGMASPGFCAWLAAKVRPHMVRAKVVDLTREDQVEHDSRTNSSVGITFSGTGLPLLALHERMARLVELPVEHLEPTNILHYQPGQQFTPHYDSFDPSNPGLNAEFVAGGQRVITILVYLNDTYEAGETEFPLISFRFRGRVGEALFWRNTSEAGGVDKATLHAGLPPSSGEKLILSQWVRDRPQNDVGFQW